MSHDYALMPGSKECCVWYISVSLGDYNHAPVHVSKTLLH